MIESSSALESVVGNQRAGRMRPAWRFVCCALTLSTVLCAARESGAAESPERAARWGIGAGIFRSGGETALLHRVSKGWIVGFDLSAYHVEDTRNYPATATPAPYRNEQVGTRLTAGPRIRRFLREEAVARPYFDVLVQALYSRYEYSTGDTNVERDLGIRTGLAFGVESELPWGFSLALHSDVLAYSWTRLEGRTSRTLPGVTIPWDGTRQEIVTGLSPELMVRVYF